MIAIDDRLRSRKATHRLWLSFLLLVLGACDAEVVYEDGLPPPPGEGAWVEIEPGGETLCARGTPYRFFVRGGDPRRLIIDFQGGGACWDSLTCSFADSLFSDSTGSLEALESALAAGAIGGLFEPSAEPALAEPTFIHIPYCTGDIHWGDARVEYDSNTTIEHRGFVNARAVLEWVYARYDAPETILVTGCSAGAYGAALHSAYVANHYPDAAVRVLADSGAGIITEAFLEESLPNWNAEAALPPFIASLQRPLNELSLPDLYIGVGQHFPRMRLAQTSTAYDADQTFFYTAMGGDAADWPGQMRESLSAISAALPETFRAYVPPGSMHCVTPYPFFFEREVAGERLSDWTRELMEGESPPENRICEGAGCCDDPICDACRENDEPWCRFCDNWPPPYAGCD